MKNKLSVQSFILSEPLLKEIHIECLFPETMPWESRNRFNSLVIEILKSHPVKMFDNKTILAIEEKDATTYKFAYDGLLILSKDEGQYINYHLRFKYLK